MAVSGRPRRSPVAPAVPAAPTSAALKILAVSDEVTDVLYGPALKQNYGHVRLLVGCGDLPYYYLEFLLTSLDVPLFYVHGNHDGARQYMVDGRVADRAEGGELIDGRTWAHRPGGAAPLLLAGLGGSPRYNREHAYQYTESEMWWRILKLVPRLLLNRARWGRYLDILVTHAPPRGIHDAADVAHRGFTGFLRLMQWFHPRLLVHGHSHVYRNDTVTRTRYHLTQVINVYPYRVLDWPPYA
jgi:predicted phosphodiesterase